MSTDPLRRTPRRPAGARLTAVLVVALVVAANVWTGCTVTKSNYKTLSLFFDGVPDPESKVATIDEATGKVVPGANMSIHAPYAEESCSECHRGRLRMTKNNSGMCASCHEGKEREHEYMHGPVAAQACLWCHHPHESKHKHLMRDSDRAICTLCHVPEMLSSDRVPEHADNARGCLECHTGHGGPRPFMLRDATPGKEGG